MIRLSLSILKNAFPVLAVSTVLFAEPANADSIIRIIGDKAKAQNDSSGSTMPSSTSSPGGSSTIRLIGDKPRIVKAPAIQHVEQPPQNQLPPPIKKSLANDNKAETVQGPLSIQSADSNGTDKETAEQQLARRMIDLKAEAERKAAEKAEQERLAQIKAEQINEAARQAAVKQEQEQLAARKAEESRIAAEKAEQTRLANEKILREKAAAEEEKRAEQERIASRKTEELRKAAEKADEERLAAARKALDDQLRPDSSQHNGSNSTSVIAPITSVNRFDPGAITEPGSASPASIWNLYLAAKANDPALSRTEARVSGSKADSDMLLSGLLPHLNSSAGVKFNSQNVSNYNNSSDGTYDFTALNYNVTAQMTLLHVPTLYSLSAAAAGLSAEQAGVAAARQNLIVKFTDSYFALLKAQTDKQIALGEINRLKQVLDQSQAFLKAGTGDIISVYEAQSRLDSAGADLTKSESNLRLAEQKLSSQVGNPITEVINYLPQQPIGPDPDNIDWWVATMEKEHPVVRQAREGVVQTSEQQKAAKAEYLPILQASGGYDVNRGTAALPTAEVKQWFVGATLSLPIYSGGETSAKVRRAAASEEERRHAFDETMDQQRENVKQAFFNLRYNISLIKALDQKKASAEIQLAAVKKGRLIGTRNAIDVLNAEQTYSMALRDCRYALYDNIIRVIQLKSAAGILTEADVSGLSGFEAPTPANGLNLIISLASR
ncbi:MAG: hypothetical protein A2076_09770 [Geobacteraceae bacterium GWC2_53_11]|nr:MAG: hypothetical protein A2076_09770 [Geobacteraceae bacterium GWC2_53_11]